MCAASVVRQVLRLGPVHPELDVLHVGGRIRAEGDEVRLGCCEEDVPMLGKVGPRELGLQRLCRFRCDVFIFRGQLLVVWMVDDKDVRSQPDLRK